MIMFSFIIDGSPKTYSGICHAFHNISYHIDLDRMPFNNKILQVYYFSFSS